MITSNAVKFGEFREKMGATCSLTGEGYDVSDENSPIANRDFSAKFDVENWTVKMTNRISCDDKNITGRTKEEF